MLATNNMWRVATEDTELGGVAMAKNDLLLLRFGSANRDDAKFPDGDRFDIERENAQDQIAFGAGAPVPRQQLLARKEMQQAFPIVLERLRKSASSIRRSPSATSLRSCCAASRAGAPSMLSVEARRIRLRLPRSR